MSILLVSLIYVRLITEYLDLFVLDLVCDSKVRKLSAESYFL